MISTKFSWKNRWISKLSWFLYCFGQRIPLFLPIIRSSLSTTHPREPDIVDRLNGGALQIISSLIEEYMKTNVDAIAADQHQLAQQSKQIEAQLASIMSALTERQKLYAKYAEKLSRIHEVSHSLTRCQLALTTALDSIETLNGQLPPTERLEEFVWSTGWIFEFSFLNLFYSCANCRKYTTNQSIFRPMNQFNWNWCG